MENLLKTIAEAVRSLPGGTGYAYVHLQDEGVALLASLGGRREATIYDGKHRDSEPYVIETATLTVGGVRFEAAASRRPATADEIAALGEKGRPYAPAHAEDFLALTRAA